MSRIERDVVLPETPCSLEGFRLCWECGVAGDPSSIDCSTARRPSLALIRAPVQSPESRLGSWDGGEGRGTNGQGNNGSEEWAKKWARFPRALQWAAADPHLPHCEESFSCQYIFVCTMDLLSFKKD